MPSDVCGFKTAIKTDVSMHATGQYSEAKVTKFYNQYYRPTLCQIILLLIRLSITKTIRTPRLQHTQAAGDTSSSSCLRFAVWYVQTAGRSLPSGAPPHRGPLPTAAGTSGRCSPASPGGSAGRHLSTPRTIHCTSQPCKAQKHTINSSRLKSKINWHP